MKKLLIGLLALGSISSFASSDCRRLIIELRQNSVEYGQFSKMFEKELALTDDDRTIISHGATVKELSLRQELNVLEDKIQSECI
jgi:hypothetical protein